MKSFQWITISIKNGIEKVGQNKIYQSESHLVRIRFTLWTLVSVI